MSDWQKKERPAKTTYGRLPPYSEEAEAALLGCCLLDSKQTLGDVIAKLKVPEAFYDVRHQNIFRHLSAMDRMMLLIPKVISRNSKRKNKESIKSIRR